MELNLLKKIIDATPELYEIFRGCPYEILSLLKINDYATGTVICRQGDIIECLYIIINGYADIYYMAENGNKYSQAIIKKGQFIGEFEIFDQRPLICSVEAITDLKLLSIGRKVFIKWLTLDNNFCSYLVQYVCHQFYLFSEKAGTDKLYSLKARLCRYLLSCSRQTLKETQVIKLKLNKEKLSEELAVTIRSVNRILQSLKTKNIIEIKTDYIWIKDLKKLTLEEENSRRE